jgi:dihydropteroate synthase
MHSLTIPADATKMKTENPVLEIKTWALAKLAKLEDAGIDLDRVIFDPGIGFGKTTEQSLSILREIRCFSDLPVRIMVGHSRKSFMNAFGSRIASDRDPETIGISLRLAEKGVDILRVHSPDLQQRSFRTFQELK